MLAGDGNIQPGSIQQPLVEGQYPCIRYKIMNSNFSDGGDFQLPGNNGATGHGFSQIPKSMRQNGMSVQVQPVYGEVLQPYQQSPIATPFGFQGIPQTQMYGGWNERGLGFPQSPYWTNDAFNQQQLLGRQSQQGHQEPTSSMIGIKQTNTYIQMNHRMGSQASSASLWPTNFSNHEQRLPSLNQHTVRPSFGSSKRTFSDYSQTSQNMATVSRGSSSSGFSRSQSSGWTQAPMSLSAFSTPSPGYPSSIPIQQPIARPGNNPASHILSIRSPESVSATLSATFPNQQKSLSYSSQHFPSSKFAEPRLPIGPQYSDPTTYRKRTLSERELESIRGGYSVGYCSLDQFVFEPTVWPKDRSKLNVWRRSIPLSRQEITRLDKIRVNEQYWSEKKEREFDENRGWEQGRVDNLGTRKLLLTYVSRHRCEHPDHNRRWHGTEYPNLPLLSPVTNQKEASDESGEKAKETGNGKEESLEDLGPTSKSPDHKEVANKLYDQWTQDNDNDTCQHNVDTGYWIGGGLGENSNAPHDTVEGDGYFQDNEHDSGQNDTNTAYTIGGGLGATGHAPDNTGATDGYFSHRAQENDHDSGQNNTDTDYAVRKDMDEAQHAPENTGEVDERTKDWVQNNEQNSSQDNSEIDNGIINIDEDVFGNEYFGSHVW
jgi:hypothetical protein